VCQLGLKRGYGKSTIDLDNSQGKPIDFCFLEASHSFPHENITRVTSTRQVLAELEVLAQPMSGEAMTNQPFFSMATGEEINHPKYHDISMIALKHCSSTSSTWVFHNSLRVGWSS
jgi:hypothetical protein